MARIANHLSVELLSERYRGAEDAVAKSHFHAIWLLAQGRAVGEVAGLLAFTPRWVQKLIERYNARGPEALGDRRSGNGSDARLLTADALAALRERLSCAPPDGGLWSGPKVAAFLAQHHGLARVHAQRGWDALQKLDYSIQRPRPRHALAADAAGQEAFKKNLLPRSPKPPRRTPAGRSRSGPATSTGSA